MIYLYFLHCQRLKYFYWRNIVVDILQKKLHSIYVELQNEFGIGFSVVLATNLNAVSKT